MPRSESAKDPEKGIQSLSNFSKKKLVKLIIHFFQSSEELNFILFTSLKSIMVFDLS